MFRLALSLGMTVDQLEQQISASELAEWMVFAAYEPLPQHRADLHAAMIASLLANVNRNTSKRPAPFTVEDFMPDYWQERMQSASITDKAKAIFGAPKHG